MSTHLNDEHAAIGRRCGEFAGAPSPAECEALYERGYNDGGTILAVGSHGAAAVAIALLGALRGHRDAGRPWPQAFLIADNRDDLAAAFRTLQRHGLTDHVIFFAGTPVNFRRQLPIVPGLVLAKDGPALGLPPCGSARSLSLRTFEMLRDTLIARVFGPGQSLNAANAIDTDELRNLFRAARAELLEPLQPGISGRGAWPFARPDDSPLPPTLPDGSPWPRVSIITPSFNQGQYIEETILSVTNQGYPNVEHIVIDGGSTDDTLRVVERHRGRLAHFVSERDEGQGHAINKGFAVATGDILTWLNSDDRLAPGALAAVAMAFHTSRADLVAGICEIHREGELIERHLCGCDDGPLPLDDLLDIENCWQGGQFFYQPEVMFTRELWRRAGGRVDRSWFYSMDYELWLRFAEHGGRLHVIGRPIAQFRVHPEQKTTLTERFRTELDEVREAFYRRTGRTPAQNSGRRFGEMGKRFVFFNDMGFNAGAGLAHGRLAAAFALAGHEVLPIALTERGTYDRTQPTANETILDQIERCRPDAVVLGNLHSAAAGPSLLAEIADRWPTLFVMHDQWALTGRCAYAGDCTKHLTGCDHTCPTPEEYPALAPERINDAWAAKHRVYSSSRPPILLGNSGWMRTFAEATLAAQHQPVLCDDNGSPHRLPVEQIRLGLPLDTFYPRDQRLCRELLALPADRFIIMTSGTSSADPRKGLAHLAAALEQLRLPDVLVVSVGHFDERQRPPIPGMRALGYIGDPQRMAMLYSAIDLFVGPSLQEAFGQVFIEAAACGTAAIGYPVGGVPEAIADGITGRVAAAVEPAALAEAIEELYRDEELRRNLGRWGRMHVENEFSLEAAYQRCFAAMNRSGIRERIDLRRKIWLRATPAEPPRVRLLDAEYPRWRALSGFGDWEGPYPADRLPRCRWAYGPVSRFEFTIHEPGRHALFIDCRNYWRYQRLRVMHQNAVLLEEDVPMTGNDADHIVHAELDLTAGRHEFELHSWQWDTSKPPRPIALLVSAINIVPVDAAPVYRPARGFSAAR